MKKKIVFICTIATSDDSLANGRRCIGTQLLQSILVCSHDYEGDGQEMDAFGNESAIKAAALCKDQHEGKGTAILLFQIPWIYTYKKAGWICSQNKSFQSSNFSFDNE